MFQSLYRKYRPKSFDDVIGQDHIVKTLTNQIIKNEIGHAYLFCGTRGTGKTSCARLFAKAINCNSPVNGSPCKACESCLALENEANLDILEIDAASNNKVEEIRDLREKVKYLPTSCKYKVYIIDEVHMLTDSAFNALLKTLEEPPKHAIFILATTEPQKLPSTILSRCMRFDFKNVSDNDLINHLKNLFTKEGISFDDDSLKLIAMAGEGSVRDTLSVADMCVAYCENNLTIEKCLDCLGATNHTILANFAEAIVNRDCATVLSSIEDLLNEGKNLNVLIKDLCSFFRDVLTVKMVKNYESIVTVPQDILTRMVVLADTTNNDYLLKILNSLASLEADLKFSLNPRIKVETTILQAMVQEDRITELNNRLKALEQKLAQGQIPVIISKTNESNEQKTVDNPAENNQNINITTKEKFSTETVDTLETKSKQTSPEKVFGEVLNYLRNNNQPYLYGLLSRIKTVLLENNKLVFCTDQRTCDALNTKYSLLQSIISSIDKELGVIIRVQTESNKIDGLKELFGEKLKII